MERLPETCTDVQAALPLFVGSDLEHAEMEAVAEHLEGCTGCRAEAERGRASRRVLWSLGEDEPEARDLWPAVREDLAREGLLPAGRAAARGPVHALPTSGWRLRVGGLAAAAALVVSFSLAGLFAPEGTTPGGTPAIASGGTVVAPTNTVSVRTEDTRALRPAGANEAHMIDSAVDLRLIDMIQGTAPAASSSLAGSRPLPKND